MPLEIDLDLLARNRQKSSGKGASAPSGIPITKEKLPSSLAGGGLLSALMQGVARKKASTVTKVPARLSKQTQALRDKLSEIDELTGITLPKRTSVKI